MKRRIVFSRTNTLPIGVNVRECVRNETQYLIIEDSSRSPEKGFREEVELSQTRDSVAKWE